MTRIAAILLLASCSAQANEPKLQISEVHRVQQFVAENCASDEPECALQCGNKFPTPDLDAYHEACLKAARDKFETAGGRA